MDRLMSWARPEGAAAEPGGLRRRGDRLAELGTGVLPGPGQQLGGAGHQRPADHPGVLGEDERVLVVAA